MGKKRILSFVLILFPVLSFSQEETEKPEIDPFSFLVQSVLDREVSLSDIEEEESFGEEIENEDVKENADQESDNVIVPQEFFDIISDVASMEETDRKRNDGVLSFLVNCYSEHGYYDTGSWVKSSPSSYRTATYVPYKGELPDYEYSDFRLPAEGKLCSQFGYRPRFKRMHKGIDIDLNTGDTVSCVLPGVVTRISCDPTGYGNYVVVAHAGDLETRYAHLNSSLVTAGQKLESGDPLGIGGATGNATGPHLHFEARYQGMAVDPMRWFNLEAILP